MNHGIKLRKIWLNDFLFGTYSSLRVKSRKTNAYRLIVHLIALAYFEDIKRPDTSTHL